METAKTKQENSVRYTEAVGKRKTSIARVRIVPARQTEIIVNGKPLNEYFRTDELQHIVTDFIAPPYFDSALKVSARITGGGIHSQGEALRHGLVRALIILHPELRIRLKKVGALTRDARIKERRKFGHKKARKSPQWSKR